MYMVIFVLNNVALLEDLLQAWEEIGVNRVTLLPSTGLGRIKLGAFLRDDLPLIPSLDDMLEHQQDTNRTLFTVVADETIVENILQATQSVVGDLGKPHTGILVVLPCTKVYGIQKSD